MEDKKISTVKTITFELIGGYFLYGVSFGILYRVISKILSPDSLILSAILTIILQGIRFFCVWRCSIFSTFKIRKRLIDKNDVQIVMKNLMIFTIILLLISGIMTYSNINKSIAKIQKATEAYTYYIDDSELVSQYKAESEKNISNLYTYLAILEIGLIVVCLGVVPLQKKAILKHSI